MSRHLLLVWSLITHGLLDVVFRVGFPELDPIHIHIVCVVFIHIHTVCVVFKCYHATRNDYVTILDGCRPHSDLLNFHSDCFSRLVFQLQISCADHFKGSEHGMELQYVDDRMH